MFKTVLMSAAAVASFAAAPAFASTNLISNGDFELGAGASITDWTILASDPDSILALKGAAYGPCCTVSGSAAAMNNQFASFGAGQSSNQALLGQNFAALAGNYKLTFDFAAIQGTQTMEVGLFDYSLGSFIFSTSLTTTGGRDLDTLFSTYSFGTTLASNGYYALVFSNNKSDTNNSDAFIDNVSFAAVPEPASWMMMIGGLGLVGASIRRRSAKTVVRFA